jgi:DNA polymerase-3 subunit chi
MKVAQTTMTDIKFYHLQSKPLDNVLPLLLEKIIYKGHKVILKTESLEQVNHLNSLLWTYHPDSFLPHGALSDDRPNLQPIWITKENENPNNADVLVLVNGSSFDNIESFELCCELFDGSNPTSLETARDKWRSYKQRGYNVSYWQQDSKGRWSNKDQE